MFDENYLLLAIIPLIISLWAQFKVKSAYKKYSDVLTTNGLTGYDAAKKILDENNLWDVRIERVSGTMTDHYDPRNNVVRLSDGVYSSTSVAAIGIAAHECGHALQHSQNYLPIKIRSAIIPVTNIGSKLAVPLVLVGLLLSWFQLAYVGLIGYALIAIFQFVTLPVEFNASSRAIASLSDMQITAEEKKGVKKVLSAAALTYVAALVAAITQMLRMAALVNRRRR